jgi:hypothetical protein
MSNPRKPATFDIPPGASVAGASIPAGRLTAAQIVVAINSSPDTWASATLEEGVITLKPKSSPPRTAGIRGVR